MALVHTQGIGWAGEVTVQVRRLVLEGVGPFERLDMRFPAGRDPKRADIHLLVGPNGTGKSSVLAAIAQCFAYAEAGLGGRLHDKRSYVAAQTTLGWRVVQPVSEDQNLRQSPDGDELIPRFVETDPAYHVYNAGRAFDAYDNVMATLDAKVRSPLPVPFAVFAYGGLRHATHTPVDGVVDQRDHPLREAATFSRPEGTRPLEQWIANTRAQHALYASNGDSSKAEERAQALDGLCKAIERVVGQPVRIQLELDPFAVRIAIGASKPVAIDLLPDGLQSLLSWLGDLLMRLDRMPWLEPGPVTQRPFVLLLDEVEVHLHPSWQRRVLPMAERLFPRAQIIASTHSPFVIGSAADAWIHPFRLEGGRAVVDPPMPTARGTSYPAIVDSILGVTEEFDVDSEEKLVEFRALWRRRLAGESAVLARMEVLATELGSRSEELANIVETERRELARRLRQGGVGT